MYYAKQTDWASIKSVHINLEGRIIVISLRDRHLRVTLRGIKSNEKLVILNNVDEVLHRGEFHLQRRGLQYYVITPPRLPTSTQFPAFCGGLGSYVNRGRGVSVKSQADPHCIILSWSNDDYDALLRRRRLTEPIKHWQCFQHAVRCGCTFQELPNISVSRDTPAVGLSSYPGVD